MTRQTPPSPTTIVAKSPDYVRRRFNLQTKLVLLLLLAVLIPLGASAYFIDQIGKVAANVAAYEAQQRQVPMEQALDVYRDVFEVTKRLHAEIGARLALRDDVRDPQATPSLADILDHEPGLLEIGVVSADGRVLQELKRPLPDGDWRIKTIEHPLADGRHLALGFAVQASLQENAQTLKNSVDEARTLATMRTALPSSYRRSFLLLVGAAALVAVIFGLLAARHITRRMSALVATARDVAGGATEARVRLTGRDEMAELGAAVDNMLDQIAASRMQVEYLQRIGAWQDVARRLAHEIKNPLTPIQLAVQQCVSSYPGAGSEKNPRFARLLADTGEIVEEEIAGLRRLVDTFRTLGQLPKVEAVPLALGELIEELRLDPAFATGLTLQPPDKLVTVRADKLLLKRVLTNLCENAMQAGNEAGVVVSWHRGDGNMAVVTVDDFGPGVKPDARERIFEPYVTSKATGTGLGLAISKKIALEHSGDLSVSTAPAPTGGARFILTLPVE